MPTTPWAQKGPGVTLGTCGAIGERAQLILVWVRAPGCGNASHPQELGVTRIRPRALDGSWRSNSRMLKNTLIGGVSKNYDDLSDVLPKGSTQHWECCGEGQHSPRSEA